MKKIVAFIITCRFSPRTIWMLLRLNFLDKRIVRDHNVYIFPYPRTNILLSKQARIILHGDMKINIREMGKNYKSAYLAMRGHSVMEVMLSCELLEGCDLQIHNGGQFVVDRFHANIDFELSCGCKTELKGEVTAGRHVRVKDFNGHKVNYDGYPMAAPITIENHTWLCTGATINPGVHVGTGAVVADNSNVIEDVLPYTFIQGNPATVVKENIKFTI